MNLAPDLLKEITAFVECARTLFENNSARFGPYANFPKNACGPASEILGRCVEELFPVRPCLFEGNDRPVCKASIMLGWASTESSSM